YFKLYCTGRYVHSAIDAMHDALAQVPGRQLDADRIRRIDVKAYRLAAMLGGKDITTSFGARFSVPFALATLLHHGRTDLAAFDEAAVANPDVQSLVARVFVEEEPEFNRHFPEQQRVDIRITLDDGATLE